MLCIDGLCLSIGDTDVFTDLTLGLRPRHCLAVTGANGAGKSTLLRCIAGLHHPDSGTITVDGIDADDSDSRFRAAVAVELGDDATFAELTVAEHLELIATTHAVGGDSRVVDVLGGAGMADLADRFPHTLSTGQRQRFTLCALWIRPARLLVIDEPESGLDVAGRDWVARCIRRACAEGSAVVMATHDPELVSRCADETLVVGR